MKYEIGDKVRIRTNLVALPEVKYGDHCLNERMLQFCGVVCTIAKVEYSPYGNPCYRIEEDARNWAWTSEMFEEVVFYPGDKVRIRNDLIPFGQYGTESFTPKMEPFKGTVCTIDHKTIRRNGKECYRIKEDGGKWGWTPEMIEERVTHFSYTLIENDEERKTTKELVKEIMARRSGKQKEMEAQSAPGFSTYSRLYRYGAFGIEPDDTDEEVRKKLDKARNEELEKATKMQEKMAKLDAMLKQLYPNEDEEKEKTNNKEDIEMSNTDLIEHKLKEELEALDKAEEKETKDKFYETPIGKAAKAFNEALEKYGNEDQKDCDINEDQLMELGEDTSDIRAEYDAKRKEVKDYYREALGLFENADTYEQKHEILTAYGILKGPKPAKAKVEVK